MLTAPENKARMDPPLIDHDDPRRRLPATNRSPTIDEIRTVKLPSALEDRIREYDWLVYELFGYDQSPTGSAPPLPPPSRAGVQKVS